MSVAAITGFIVQLIEAGLVVAIALVVIEAWAKEHLRTSSYERWHDLVKDRYSFITTTIGLAVLLIVGASIIRNEIAKARYEAASCARDPSTCERPD